MKTTARLLVLSLAAVLALSGCMRVQMNLVLNEDDSVSGTYVFAIQEGLGSELGSSDEDAVDELFGDTSADIPGATSEDYKEDGYVGTRITFANQSFADLDLDSEDMSIRREGNDYILEGAFDTGDSSELGSLPASAEMTLSVTFPGPIADTNGTVEGNTVTWDLLNDSEDVYARGAASADTGLPSWLWLVIGLGVLVLAGAVVTVVLISRKKQPATGPEATALATDPAAAPVFESEQAPLLGEATAADAPVADGTADAPPAAPATDDAPVVNDAPVADDGPDAPQTRLD